MVELKIIDSFEGFSIHNTNGDEFLVNFDKMIIYNPKPEIQSTILLRYDKVIGWEFSDDYAHEKQSWITASPVLQKEIDLAYEYRKDINNDPINRIMYKMGYEMNNKMIVDRHPK